MWKKETTVNCPKCGEELVPGLMNLAHHWTVCKKNHRTLLSILENNTPLTDEIKRTQKINTKH